MNKDGAFYVCVYNAKRAWRVSLSNPRILQCLWVVLFSGSSFLSYPRVDLNSVKSWNTTLYSVTCRANSWNVYSGRCDGGSIRDVEALAEARLISDALRMPLRCSF